MMLMKKLLLSIILGIANSTANVSNVAILCTGEFCGHALLALSLRNLTGIRVNNTDQVYGKGYGAVITGNEAEAFELATHRQAEDEYIVLAPESTSSRKNNETMLIRNLISDTRLAEAAAALVKYYERKQVSLVYDLNAQDIATAFLEKTSTNEDDQSITKINQYKIDTPLTINSADSITSSIETQLAIITLQNAADHAELFRASLRRDPVTFILTNPKDEAFQNVQTGNLNVEAALGAEGALGFSRIEPDLPSGYLEHWATLASTDCGLERTNYFRRRLEDAADQQVVPFNNATISNSTNKTDTNTIHNNTLNYNDTNNIHNNTLNGTYNVMTNSTISNSTTTNSTTTNVMSSNETSTKKIYCDEDGDLSTVISGAGYWIEAIWLYADANGDFGTMLDENDFDVYGDKFGNLDIVNVQLDRNPRLSSASYVNVGEYSSKNENLSLDEDEIILFLEDDDLTTTATPTTQAPTLSPTTHVPTVASDESKKKSNNTFVIPVLALALLIFICAICGVLCAARRALTNLEKKQRIALVSSLNAFEVHHDFDPDIHEMNKNAEEEIILSDNDDNDTSSALRVVCKSGARTRQGREYIVETQRVLVENNDETRSIRNALLNNAENEEVSDWRELECWYWEAETSSLGDFEQVPNAFFVDEKKPSVSWIGYDDLAQDQISALWRRFQLLPTHVRDSLRREANSLQTQSNCDEVAIGGRYSDDASSNNSTGTDFLQDIDPLSYCVVLRDGSPEINYQDLEDESQPFLASVDNMMSPRALAAKSSAALLVPDSEQKITELPSFQTKRNNKREINLATMTQTNLATGRTRRIKMEPKKRSVRHVWFWRENFRNLQKWRSSQITLDGTLWVKYNDLQVQRALTDAYLHYLLPSSPRENKIPEESDALRKSISSSSLVNYSKKVILEQVQQSQDQLVRLDCYNEIAEAMTEAKYIIDAANLVQINTQTNFRRPVCLLILTKYERNSTGLSAAKALFGIKTCQKNEENRKSLPVYTLESAERQSSSKRLLRTPSAVWTSLTTPKNFPTSRKAGAESPLPFIIPQMPKDLSTRDCLHLKKGMLVSVIYEHPETEDWRYGREIITSANKIVQNNNDAGWFPMACVQPATGLSVNDIPDRALQDFSFLLPPRHWNCAQQQAKRSSNLQEIDEDTDIENLAYEAEEPTLVDIAGTREAKEVLSAFDLDYFDVVEILRIENLQLWRPYATKRLSTVEAENAILSKQQKQEKDISIKKKKIDNSDIERSPVFHGTTNDAAHKIAIEGFNRDFTSATHSQHGKGAYFSIQAAHACFHTFAKPDDKAVQHVLVCRIVSGSYTTGSPGLVAPPFRPDAPHRRFDTTVDDPDEPAIFVTYSDYQAYPEYMVKLLKSLSLVEKIRVSSL